jgi:mevalonate kinase
MKLVDLPFPFWFEAGNKELQNMSIFLVNTKKTRSTGPLVQLFLEMRKEKQFVSLCDQIFLPLNEKLIEQFLSGDMISMYPSFHQLSEFQFTYFRSMIPSFVQDHWKKGLDHDLYALKLCGAGGGGFLLGITRDLEKTQQDLHPFEIRRLF